VVDHALVLTVGVLGPVEVLRDGVAVELGGPQPRAVIAHLALDAGRVVSVERLIDRLWGDEPPRTPLGTLQSYISRLRRAVEPDRAPGAPAEVLVSEAPGYVLRVPEDQIDVHRFRSGADRARAAASAGRFHEALAEFDEALALWRGPAFGGTGIEDHARTVLVRLDEEHDSAIEDRFAALLALGRHAEAIPQLQSAVDEHPLRERLWAQLALALYRSSRQADALRALSDARRLLLDELGLDPGPEIRELENRILAQDPGLALPAAEPAAAPPAAPTRVAAHRTELVGRAVEWEHVTSALEAARSGTSHLLLIEGEPGIGKTTLSDALLAHARETGWRTATGRCVEPGLAPSLWPCIEVVRSMLAADDDGARDSGNPLRDLVTTREEGGATLSPVEMADHFVGLLDELAEPPWVVLFDDLHWADRATLDVIRLVLDRLGRRRLVVVGAHRPTGTVPGSMLGQAIGALRGTTVRTTRLELSPLDADDVSRLMELTTGVAPSPALADRVRARAGGNPLFVAELARLAGERGLTSRSDVPDAIRDVVRNRLATLPERGAAELEVAAVLGERFDLRTVMAASEHDPEGCLDALDAAIVTRILVPEDGAFRFAHALVRDAVLAGTSPLRLARLHHRAAEAILATRGDGPDEAEPIAHHRLASASFADPIVVARAAVRASDVARWRAAFDTADELAEQALAVLAGVPRSAAVSKIEVSALESIVGVATRREDDVVQAAVAARVQEVADQTGSDAAAALAMFLNWGEIDEVEDLRPLAEPLDAALALAERTTDAYAIVTTRYMLAGYALLTGRLDEAAHHIALAIEASGATDPDGAPDHVPLVVLPVVGGLIAAVRGDAALAREYAVRRAASWWAQRTEVDPTVRILIGFNRALVSALLGEPAAVLDDLRDVAADDPSGYLRSELATSAVLSNWARVLLGEPAALDDALAAMADMDRNGERVLRTCLRTFVADACLALGDRRAVDLLADAWDEGVRRDERWWLAETRRLQAVADVRFGDGSRAVAWLDEAEELAIETSAALVLERVRASRTELAGAAADPVLNPP
jgi:DNA-binding SARP family transcriptional activator